MTNAQQQYLDNLMLLERLSTDAKSRASFIDLLTDTEFVKNANLLLEQTKYLTLE